MLTFFFYFIIIISRVQLFFFFIKVFFLYAHYRMFPIDCNLYSGSKPLVKLRKSTDSNGIEKVLNMMIYWQIKFKIDAIQQIVFFFDISEQDEWKWNEKPKRVYKYVYCSVEQFIFRPKNLNFFDMSVRLSAIRDTMHLLLVLFVCFVYSLLFRDLSILPHSRFQNKTDKCNTKRISSTQSTMDTLMYYMVLTIHTPEHTHTPVYWCVHSSILLCGPLYSVSHFVEESTCVHTHIG